MSSCVGACSAFGLFRPSVVPQPSDEAWGVCAHGVEQALVAPAPNLLRVERLIRGACEGKAVNPEVLIDRALSTETLKTLWKAQKKWVEAGFEESIVETDPEAVAYAVDTGLVHTLAMFRDASALDGETAAVQFQGGKALFKVERLWLPIGDFKGRIQYSPDEKKFIGWNCIHPDGFVRRDDTKYETLYPVAKLKPEVFDRVLRQGREFWEGREEVDEGREKPYVLQVMTTGRPCFPHMWCLTNLDDHTPEHSSTRLIGPNGFVYSFGTKMRSVDADRVTKITNILSTAETHVPVPDYEETRPSQEKRVTSIALTKERFEAICRYVETANKGFPFNFAEANCARFVVSLMALAGVELDVKMTVGEFLLGCLPALSDVPAVGRPLSNVAAAVAFVAVPIIDILGAFLRYVLPQCIQRVHMFVVRKAEQLLRLIGAFVTNLFVLTLLGAGRTYIADGVRYEPNRGADGPLALPTSTRLMRWKDLFRPDALIFYHAIKLRRWQLAQHHATTVFTDPKYGFACLDPAAGVVT